MRKAAFCVILLVFLSLIASAQAAEAREADVAVSTAVSAAFQLGTVLESFLYDQEYFPYLLLGTATLQNVPSLFFGTRDAFCNYGIQFGLDGLALGNMLLFPQDGLTPVLFNAAHKFSMFGTYDSYTDLRSRATDPDYRAIDTYSFAELALASFDPENYEDMSVWGYLGSIAVFSLASMAMADQANAVWTTGEAYIGGTAFPIWAGVSLILLLQVPNFIMTGVGEEALYRGVYYEEMSYRLGEWPAKIVDAVYFTASHIPQQWDDILSKPAWNTVIKSALSIGQAFWFQYVYEWRGLKAAVVAHSIGDIIVFFCDWLIQAGVPNGSGFSINDRVLSIGFVVPL